MVLRETVFPQHFDFVVIGLVEKRAGESMGVLDLDDLLGDDDNEDNLESKDVPEDDIMGLVVQDGDNDEEEDLFDFHSHAADKTKKQKEKQKTQEQGQNLNSGPNLGQDQDQDRNWDQDDDQEWEQVIEAPTPPPEETFSFSSLGDILSDDKEESGLDIEVEDVLPSRSTPQSRPSVRQPSLFSEEDLGLDLPATSFSSPPITDEIDLDEMLGEGAGGTGKSAVDIDDLMTEENEGEMSWTPLKDRSSSKPASIDEDEDSPISLEEDMGSEVGPVGGESLVPPQGGILKKILIGVAVLVLLIVALFGFKAMKGGSKKEDPTPQSATQTVVEEKVPEEADNPESSLEEVPEDDLEGVVNPNKPTPTPSVDKELVELATAVVGLGNATIDENPDSKIPGLKDAINTVNPNKTTESEVELLEQAIVRATQYISMPPRTKSSDAKILSVTPRITEIEGKEKIALLVTLTKEAEVSGVINVNGVIEEFPATEVAGVATFVIDAPKSGAFAYIIDVGGGNDEKSGVFIF